MFRIVNVRIELGSYAVACYLHKCDLTSAMEASKLPRLGAEVPQLARSQIRIRQIVPIRG